MLGTLRLQSPRLNSHALALPVTTSKREPLSKPWENPLPRVASSRLDLDKCVTCMVAVLSERIQAEPRGAHKPTKTVQLQSPMTTKRLAELARPIKVSRSTREQDPHLVVISSQSLTSAGWLGAGLLHGTSVERAPRHRIHPGSPQPTQGVFSGNSCAEPLSTSKLSSIWCCTTHVYGISGTPHWQLVWRSPLAPHWGNTGVRQG